MNSNLVGSHWVLATLPIWATAFILYMVTIGVIFVIRDRCEGLFYNTSYSAMIGDGALIVAALMAAEILKRGGVSMPEWLQNQRYHAGAGLAGLMLGVIWLTLDRPEQWGDRYHHAIIAPVLLYLVITLLPVIFRNGSKNEKLATVFLVAVWVVLVVYDKKTKRLDQRNYQYIGRHLDEIKQDRWQEGQCEKLRRYLR